MDKEALAAILRDLLGESEDWKSLAEACGVSISTLYAWRSGSRYPSAQTLAALLDARGACAEWRAAAWRAFGVPPVDLACGGAHDDPTNGDEPAGCA